MIKERWLHKFEIKPGRWVFHPTEATKAEGREIKAGLLQNVSLPKNYWHLREGGHVKALYSHINSQFFLKLDIADFFGSINRSRITRCLRPISGYDQARLVALQSTVRHPTTAKYMLPYGFVQSPLLASIALHQSALGTYLSKLGSDKNCVVSVYVDDIIVSSCDQERLEDNFRDIKERTERSGFQINYKKTHGPAESTTAFNIQLSRSDLRITEEKLTYFRSAYIQAENELRREGILSYINSINRKQGSTIKNL